MAPLASISGAVVSLAIFLLLLLPPGYALIRLARGTPGTPADLGTALGVGYSAVLPLFLAEQALGGPYLLLPVTLIALLWLRPSPAGWPAVRGWLEALALPLLLGALALWVNLEDLTAGAEGIGFRLGFDVSDRVYYALVGQELLRSTPATIENPVFAGLPLQYSLFPSLAGALLSRYGGAPLLPAFLVYQPAIALVFVGLAVSGLLEATGTAGRPARILTALLVALGGDVSFLLKTHNITLLERTRYFFVHHSMSAESLYYNTWMFGIPLALVVLTLAHRWARDGRKGDLVLGALVLGGLWETKVFAFVPLFLGSLAAGLALRRPRLMALGLASTLFAAPWIAASLSTGPPGEPPLVVSPLYHVHTSLQTNDTLAALVAALRLHDAGPPLKVVAWAAVVVVYLLGGFGVRVLGFPRLWRAARSDTSGFHAFVALSMAVGVLLFLLLAGSPVAANGAQFLILAHTLAWIDAAPALAALLVHPTLVPRLAGLALAVAAFYAPASYVARKCFPNALTDPRSLDRLSIVLPPDTVRACHWLLTRTPASDRLVVGLDDPENLGLKPLYVAALSGRRLAAANGDYHLGPRLAESRRSLVRRLYETESAPEGERILAELGVRWVWEDAARPLRFRSPRLTPAFASGRVKVYRFEATSSWSRDRAVRPCTSAWTDAHGHGAAASEARRSASSYRGAGRGS